MSYLKLSIYILLLVLFSIKTTAQEEVDEDILEQMRKMSLKEILDVKISIASQTPLSMREAPGILTLITKEDILNSGARDLMDALNLLVPGFHFMQSEFGPIGIGVRGLWAYEGKVLLLVDGIECNEDGFSSVIFGNHYLLENVDRIEIIRGPGSVIYGGSAGLAVINIITVKPDQLDGGYAGIQVSRMFETFSHRNLSFGAGKTFGEIGLSLTGYIGEGRLSDRDYIPYFPNWTSFETQKIKFNPINLNFNINYKGLDFRSLYERQYLYYSFPINFSSYNFQLKYDYRISEKLNITAKLDEKIQKPWRFESSGQIPINGSLVDTIYRNFKTTQATRLSAFTTWEFLKNTHLLSGFEIFNIEVNSSLRDGYYEIPLGNNSYDANIRSYVAYGQIMYLPELVNITIGGRIEHSNIWGTYFVPRIALTKIFGPFHMKGMISQAYRNPSGRYFNEKIKPEKGMNYEMEAGYQITQSNFLVVNLYDIHYKDVITVKADTSIFDFPYGNLDKIGSQGIELEYKILKNRFNFGLNLSYYRITENTLELYKVNPNEKDVLGFPSLKMNAFAGIKFAEGLSINPSLSYIGERYGYIKGFLPTAPNEPITHVLKEFDPTIIINLNFRTHDLFLSGLQLDLGVNNLLNSNYEYIQAFRGNNAPLPAASTSLTLRAMYELTY